jgi:hypothetical protein
MGRRPAPMALERLKAIITPWLGLGGGRIGLINGGQLALPQRLEQQLESNDPKGAPQVGFSNS